jgi:hypothetical protein
MKAVMIACSLIALAGCSNGLQEVGFAIPDEKDGVHYIVTRDVVSSRWTANQPHTAGMFHCVSRYTSEEMAMIRQWAGDHTWYKGCTPTTQHPQHQYVMTGDQSLASLAQGPASAALLGTGIGVAGYFMGKGLRDSGDSVTQNGGGASAASHAGSIAQGGSVRNSITVPRHRGH